MSPGTAKSTVRTDFLLWSLMILGFKVEISPSIFVLSFGIKVLPQNNIEILSRCLKLHFSTSELSYM